MSMSGPVLLLVVPLLGGLVLWLLRRWARLTAGAGVALAWGMALWLWRLPFPAEFVLYGRSLHFTSGIQTLFLILLVCLGGLFLLSLFWPQGRYFVPFGLAVLSPMAAALVVRPFTLGTLFWFMAVLGFGVLIQSDRAGQTQGAWRYVLLMLLAVLLLLVGGWMVQTAQSALQATASRLLAAAFLLLLAGFPFHIWLQPVVTMGRGLVLVLMLGLGQVVLIIFVYEWLAAYPWLGGALAFRQMIQWSSGLTAVTAGVLAMTARSMNRLLGSLLLLDMSFSAALLLVPAVVGWQTAVLLPLVRTIGLLLAVLGWHGMTGGQDGPELVSGHGAGRHYPIAALSLAYGLVSLLGLPLTPGFSGRWLAVVWLARPADVSVWLLAGLLLAMGGGIFGAWRSLAPLLQRREGETAVTSEASFAWRVVLLAGLLLGASLAVLPYGINMVQRLAVLWVSTG